MKKWMVLFILFISLVSIAQVLSSKELIDLNKLNDKKLKKHLVSRGYAIDPLSDTKGKHYTAMPGRPIKYTKPIVYWEPLTNKCFYTTLKREDTTIEFRTADSARYNLLAKQFYALGFLKFAPGNVGDKPVMVGWRYTSLTDSSSQYPNILLQVSFDTISSPCDTKGIDYKISISTYREAILPKKD